MAPRRKPQPADSSRWAPWVVGLAVLFVFLPAVSNDFVNWDDDRNFLDNPHYRGLGPTQIRWAFEAFLLGHYHPLTWLSSSLDYVLWGMNPAGYHFTNVLLHGAVALLVFFLFLEVLRKVFTESKPSDLAWAAAVGALYFALHPLRVESVAWASERRDVLCGVFYVGALLLYVRGRLKWALGLFAGALLSKILAATLPIVLLLLDVYPLRRRWTTRRLLEKAPFFALAFAAGLFTMTRTAGGLAGAAADLGLFPGLRVGLSLYGLAFYLWKTILPIGLYPQYVATLEPQITDPGIIGGALLFTVLTALSIHQWKRRPWIAVVWGSYVVTLAPVLSLLRLDRHQVVADHHTYLATIGLAGLAGAACLVWPHAAKKTAPAGLVLFALLTVLQVTRWSDSVSLWSRTAAAQPLSIIAHNNLGRALLEIGDVDAALASFHRAVGLDPSYAQAQYNLGSVQMRQGDLASAETALRAAVNREPRFAQAQNALANCLLRQGRAAEALPHYEAALQAAPGYADAHYNFAVALEYLGQSLRAVYHYRQARSLDPSNTDAVTALQRLNSLDAP